MHARYDAVFDVCCGGIVDFFRNKKKEKEMESAGGNNDGDNTKTIILEHCVVEGQANENKTIPTNVPEV
eukprot:UN03668